MKREEESFFSQFMLIVVGSVLSVLFAGNCYFIKRLVDRLDSTEAIVWQLRQDVAVLKISLDDIGRQYNSCCMHKEAVLGPNLLKSNPAIISELEKVSVD